MPIDNDLAERHILAIDASIAELFDLESRTAEPAPLPHQFIGTVVDNTLTLLTAPANSLDNAGRVVSISDTVNWLSVMQAVHRSFYSSILLAVERGLKSICDQHNVEIDCKRKLTFENLLNIVETETTHSPETTKALKELRNLTKSNRPEFSDYLNTALNTTALNKKTKTEWRNFFAGLSIVRNKVSHSDPTLSEIEQSNLRKWGFSPLVSDDGILKINPRHYTQTVNSILDFFDILQKNTLPAQN
jgi:hypothetical protein